MAVALLPPTLTAWILWLAPVGDVTADRTALAARDFTALWTAGRTATSNAIGVLSDPILFTRLLRDWFGAGIPDQIWPYPPTALLLAAPLSLPPIGYAFVLYTAGTLLLLWLALRSGGLRPAVCAAVLVSPAVADNALAGQNGALTAALLIGGLLLLDRRPAVAGALLGGLIIKPQLGLLLPICLLAARRWRTILFAASTAASLILASALLFGFDVWTEYVCRARPMISAYIEAPWQARPGQLIFASAFMAARSLGAGLSLAWLAQGAVALLCAVLAWCAWRKPDLDPQLRMALTASLAMAASPWIHGYDMPALAVCVVVLLPRLRPVYRPVLVLAWFWPGALAIVPVGPAVSFLSNCGIIFLAARSVFMGEKRQP